VQLFGTFSRFFFFFHPTWPSSHFFIVVINGFQNNNMLNKFVFCIDDRPCAQSGISFRFNTWSMLYCVTGTVSWVLFTISSDEGGSSTPKNERNKVKDGLLNIQVGELPSSQH